MFFTFFQNNTHGYFKEPAMIVIVEAESWFHANRIAEGFCGVYFDGVKKGIDCDCCGSRWSRKGPENTGSPVPSLYNIPLGEYPQAAEDEGESVLIRYAPTESLPYYVKVRIHD